MEVVNYCTLMIGILACIYGLFEMMTKKSPFKEDEKYTEESSERFALVEGLIMTVGGLCVCGLGLSCNGAVLEEKMTSIFIGVIIGLAALDMIAAKVIQKMK